MTSGELCIVNAPSTTRLSAEGRRTADRSGSAPEIEPGAGREVIDAAGAFLVPPLVNGHTHAAMTLFRGHGDDLPLMRWLQEAIWPVEAKLTDEDVYWGTRLACLEMVRTGTSEFWDMYWEPEAVARAVEDAGIRATVGPPMIDPKSAVGLSDRDRTIVGQLEPPRRLRSADSIGGFAPLDLHGLDRGPRVRNRPGPGAGSADPDPPCGDQARSRRLRREVRRTAGVLPRQHRNPGRADRARPRRLPRRCRTGADRRSRRDRRHQPGRQHEARGGRRFSLSGRPPGRGPDRARHRRCRFEQLARPASPTSRPSPWPSATTPPTPRQFRQKRPGR